MVVCDYCGAELSEGKACLECSQTFCNKCSHEQKCFICGNKLVSIKVEQQKHGSNVIQWILSTQGKKFGLASEYSEIPPLAFDLLKPSISISSGYEMILFPTKTESRKFLKKLVKEMPEGTLIVGEHPEEKPPDRSRYTVLKQPEQKKFYVLLNVASITESTLRFLITFFNGLFLHTEELSFFNERVMKSIAETIMKSIKHYNSKYGIRFFVADEFTRLMANRLLAKMWSSYAEFLTLKEIACNRSFSRDVSAYASHKISAIFDLVRNEKFYFMTDLVNLAGAHADALNIVYSLSENAHLFQLSMNKFQRESKSILTRLGKQSDLVSAMYNFVKKMSNKAVYRDYENFARETCRNLTRFLSSLKPTYVWLEETYSLAMIVDSYRKQIEENLEPWHPQFGNIDNFMIFLSRVFKKIERCPELYPEIPIIAGYLLLQLLEYLAEWRGKQGFLNKALIVGKKLAAAMDKTLPEIKQKNSTSPFRNVDIATIYTGLARTCMKFGKKNEMINLLDKARLVAERFNLQEIKCLVNWHEFILNQDYDKLLQVYNLYSSISSDFMALEPQFKTIAFLSRAILEREGKPYHYQKAIEFSTELTSDESLFDRTSLFHDLVSGRILYYIANLFLKIEEAINKENVQERMTTLKKATVYANALEIEIGASFDPIWVFVLKTRIVADLIGDNMKSVDHQIGKLERFSVTSATTRNFLNIAKSWYQATKKQKWRALPDTLDLPYENRDPWSLLLAKIIESKSKQQLTKKLKHFGKAVLFVEGPTEEVVIPTFAAKMRMHLHELGIGVIPLRGSSKGKYHLKFWKEVSEKVPVSLFMLVDSHARKEAEEAVKNNLIEKNQCFVLQRGSIEDYYPAKTLCEVIETLCDKRPLEKDLTKNRIKAIDSFLKKNGYTADWKLIVGRRVAEKISSNELLPEIRGVLRKIKSSI